MNLSWIAAVLAPRDIASHPYVPDDAPADSQEPIRLANLILGTGSGKSSYSLRLLQQTMRNDTVRDAVPKLASLIREPSDDLARTGAYTLVLCSAAAELDDYETCFATIDYVIDGLDKVSADSELVRGALLQQKALRLRDAGLPHLPTLRSAAEATDRVDPDRCTPFAPGPNSTKGYREIIETAKENLRAASGSLISIDDIAGPDGEALVELRETGSRLQAEIVRRSISMRASEYASFVRQMYKDDFGQRGRVLGGSRTADLFASALSLELSGHGNVYAARRELALLRLVQRERDEADVADALRLLRHSTAKDELTIALRTLVDAGPLAALARDAQQILHSRTAPHLLRVVELQVLRAAADVLSSEDSRRGFDATMAALAAGGPQDLPGKWQLPVLRRSVAWAAAAALGNVCQQTTAAAEMLLAEAVNAPEDDQTFDEELRRAVALLDWTSIDAETRQRWEEEALSLLADRLPGTMELVALRCGQRAPRSSHDSPIELLVDDLNAALVQKRRPEVSEKALAPLIQELGRIRAEAADGQHSFGGVDVAAVAAAVLIASDDTSLWQELTEFLLDPAVSADDTALAFDRLSGADIALPEKVADAFAKGIRQRILNTAFFGFHADMVVFPAALRFASVHGLISEADTYTFTARLLGEPDASSRREGARTVAMLARRRHTEGLLPLVLPFTRDENAPVRATAAAALVQLAQYPSQWQSLILDELHEIVKQDGTLVARTLLNELEQTPSPAIKNSLLPYRLLSILDHPANSVRRRATKVLGDALSSHP
ncbi:hypothetical protein [Actinoplanes sp. NPDC089786]|uniref:hypothetical protein n=1 Tax=Actinoplanes sp. NPDC089786 TaxID=3155185 RepID=UPI0034390425